MTARVIDEDLAHGAAGDIQEMHAVGPGDARLVDQLEPGVVNELGGLQRVVGTLAAHQRPGDPAELLVGGGEQRLLGRRRPGSAVRDEFGEIWRRQIVHGGVPS